MSEEQEEGAEESAEAIEEQANGPVCIVPESNYPWRRLILFLELTIGFAAFCFIIWAAYLMVDNDQSFSLFSLLSLEIAGHVILVSGLLAAILLVVRIVFDRIEKRLTRTIRGKFSAAAEHKLTDIVAGKGTQAIESLVALIVNIVQICVYATVTLIYIPLVSQVYPETKKLGELIVSYFTDPLKVLAHTLFSAVPDGLAILVYLLLAVYLLRFLKLFAEALRENEIRINGLPAESVTPIYQILRVMIIVFAFVAIFRRLPGADNPEFRAIAGFIALLASLSASSAIGNFVAGLVLTFMQPYRKGDRVRIGEVFGDVVDYSLVSTRIVTPRNERVSVPSMSVLKGEVVNYSTYAAVRGVAVTATVSIGYNTPRQTVENLLLEAAKNTSDIEEQPSPFVVTKALGDFSINYELYAYTRRPRKLLRIHSELHSKILDAFNAAGVEIMSPMYHATRDGSAPAIAPMPEAQKKAS